MAIDLSARIKEAMTYTVTRLGASIQYKRYKETTYDPETGETKVFWETPTFNALIGTVQTSEIDASAGRLQEGDVSFLFKASEFTSQGASDDAEPTAGDEIVYDSNTYEVDLGSGQTLFKKDMTGTLYTVYARRRG